MYPDILNPQFRSVGDLVAVTIHLYPVLTEA